jgi:hypothetical protein
MGEPLLLLVPLLPDEELPLPLALLPDEELLGAGLEDELLHAATAIAAIAMAAVNVYAMPNVRLRTPKSGLLVVGVGQSRCGRSERLTLDQSAKAERNETIVGRGFRAFLVWRYSLGGFMLGPRCFLEFEKASPQTRSLAPP